MEPVTSTASERGAGLTNLEDAPLCRGNGSAFTWSPAVFNCAAPDTGNIETLERFGSPEQKERWLGRMLNGEIHTAFAMTEPAVASSDATNIECEIRRKGDDYVINGRKWWISGMGEADCQLMIVMEDSPHGSETSPTINDPRAARHAGHPSAQGDDSAWLRRCPAWPYGNCLRQRKSAGRATSC
jgi:alkylation response protein AidB-like acyl-CoA dehydrogenase